MVIDEPLFSVTVADERAEPPLPPLSPVVLVLVIGPPPPMPPSPTITMPPDRDAKVVGSCKELVVTEICPLLTAAMVPNPPPWPPLSLPSLEVKPALPWPVTYSPRTPLVRRLLVALPGTSTLTCTFPLFVMIVAAAGFPPPPVPPQPLYTPPAPPSDSAPMPQA
ncbi:hypothetical protein D3C87_1291150 [compost metagenome]